MLQFVKTICHKSGYKDEFQILSMKSCGKNRDAQGKRAENL